MATSRQCAEPGQETRRNSRRNRDAAGTRGWRGSGSSRRASRTGSSACSPLKLALGDGGSATSRQGALKQHRASLLREDRPDRCWRSASRPTRCGGSCRRIAERPDAGDGDGKVWGKRAGYVGRGLVYAALTYSTVRIVTGSGGSGSRRTQRRTTRPPIVLAWPGGRWIVGAAGLAVIGVGFWNLYRGLARKFEDRWRVGRTLAGGAALGRGAPASLGHVARFVVFGLIGVFAIKAAVDYKPKDAIGLDGALQKLAHASYGPWLLGLTAAGLFAYGVYCLVDARLRDVSANP